MAQLINTLRNISGLQDNIVDWNNAAVLFVDYQNEYVDGILSLGKAGKTALGKAEKLLENARSKNVPIFHILQKASSTSSVFNCDSPLSDAVDCIKPNDNETVIHKTLPNSFFKTDLEEMLHLTGRKQLIILGFMSHMCVTATTIRAVELGYDVIVCEDACATRPLPDKNGNSIDQDLIHLVSMAALNDRYASIQPLHNLVEVVN
ncbi:isochorismatase family protein [Aliivibrio fischeri]|uniref:isochorismatase family protein n=1 Tax=Aliivibrio fischeri TaxID=668 RepID=UPI00084C9299|nr:isochorismatase family protein [Aliivibrio fischeri]OED52752.1 isochorismatase [Aliivibrio fischeri]